MVAVWDRRLVDWHLHLLAFRLIVPACAMPHCTCACSASLCSGSMLCEGTSACKSCGITGPAIVQDSTPVAHCISLAYNPCTPAHTRYARTQTIWSSIDGRYLPTNTPAPGLQLEQATPEVLPAVFQCVTAQAPSQRCKLSSTTPHQREMGSCMADPPHPISQKSSASFNTLKYPRSTQVALECEHPPPPIVCLVCRPLHVTRH